MLQSSWTIPFYMFCTVTKHVKITAVLISLWNSVYFNEEIVQGIISIPEGNVIPEEKAGKKLKSPAPMSKMAKIIAKIRQDIEVYWTTGIVFEKRCRFVNFGVKVHFWKSNREFLKFTLGTKKGAKTLKTQTLINRTHWTILCHYCKVNVKINMYHLWGKNYCFYKHYREFLKFDAKNFLF